MEELLCSLAYCKNNEAAGPDDLSSEFFKNLPQRSLSCLVNLFNIVVKEGNIPDTWANINIKMIHKKGDKTDPTNYRPIALANAILKIFTTILNKRLNTFAKTHDSIPEYQSGFREDRSCLDNIFSLNSKKRQGFCPLCGFQRLSPQ